MSARISKIYNRDSVQLNKIEKVVGRQNEGERKSE